MLMATIDNKSLEEFCGAGMCNFAPFMNPARGLGSSHVVEQGHEPEIHMQLLVAMEQSHPWIIGHKIHRELLVATQHGHIFHDARGWYSRHAGQLETVTVQVNRVQI